MQPAGVVRSETGNVDAWLVPPQLTVAAEKTLSRYEILMLRDTSAVVRPPPKWNLAADVGFPRLEVKAETYYASVRYRR